MGTAVAEGQKDALPWTDVTLSTSYKKCYEWTSRWTSPMNNYMATGRRKYVFPDPCVIFFFMLRYVLPPLTILVTLVFSCYEQVYRTQKVCISGRYVLLCDRFCVSSLGVLEGFDARMVLQKLLKMSSFYINAQLVSACK